MASDTSQFKNKFAGRSTPLVHGAVVHYIVLVLCMYTYVSRVLAFTHRTLRTHGAHVHTYYVVCTRTQYLCTRYKALRSTPWYIVPDRTKERHDRTQHVHMYMIIHSTSTYVRGTRYIVHSTSTIAVHMFAV